MASKTHERIAAIFDFLEANPTRYVGYDEIVEASGVDPIALPYVMTTLEALGLVERRMFRPQGSKARAKVHFLLTGDIPRVERPE
jgi:hypothetical protein